LSQLNDYMQKVIYFLGFTKWMVAASRPKFDMRFRGVHPMALACVYILYNNTIKKTGVDLGVL
jgi:hypothetical protein